jgi:hypothetical protein
MLYGVFAGPGGEMLAWDPTSTSVPVAMATLTSLGRYDVTESQRPCLPADLKGELQRSDLGMRGYNRSARKQGPNAFYSLSTLRLDEEVLGDQRQTLKSASCGRQIKRGLSPCSGWKDWELKRISRATRKTSATWAPTDEPTKPRRSQRRRSPRRPRHPRPKRRSPRRRAERQQTCREARQED